MKKQRYIVEIEMPDGDMVSSEWLRELIQQDCDVEDDGRQKVFVKETSLPSNLDEAAKRIAYDICKQLPNGEEKDGIVYYAILAAIAGAEWMAGQGWSRELEVKEDAGGYPYIDKHIELYDYDTDTPLAKKGDKVVVQIRKK